MTMTDHIEEPESLEQIASKMEERALKLAPELGTMTPEEREQHFAEIEAAATRERHLARCAQLATTLPPTVFRHEVALQPEVSKWLDDFWSPDERSKDSLPGLVLIGRPGCGKTQNAWTIVTSLLSRGWDDVHFEDVTDLLDELTRRSQSKTSDADLIAKLAGVGLLVLDDLGAKPLTSFREERIGKIFDERWKYQRPTIVTTNFAAPSFSEHFGDRIASRISGLCFPVTFPNHDRRSGINYSEGKR